jgi:hypothetical protein
MQETEHRSFEVPEETRHFPSGHDARVVSDEPVVTVDWFGASSHAK